MKRKSIQVSKIIFLVFLLILIITFLELFFRGMLSFYTKFTGRVPDYTIGYPDLIFLEPHPYLGYVNKRNIRKIYEAKYPYSEKFLRHYATNSFGFMGTKDYTMHKPKDVFRIICIGGSTTQNLWDEFDYHYPRLLEDILNNMKITNLKFEVLNAGMQGWTSTESLINFELRLLDFEPDLIIVYDAVNDIFPLLTPMFKSDYSHYRIHRCTFRPNLFNYIPPFYTSKLYSFVRYKVINKFGLPVNLNALFTTNKVDYQRNFQDFKIYKRNYRV